MVADMISADYGWLHSPDGEEKAWVLLKAGKNREGYFTNDNILAQADKAMDILEKHYPNEEHVFIFDNATTHTKRADGALSARYMPKGTSKWETNWGVEVNQCELDGKLIYAPNGQIAKMKVCMMGAKLPNGSDQSLYFKSGPNTGLFKGMAIILQERGLVKESKLRAECKGFKCEPGATRCCCRRVL